ncbi:hypothetical protein ACJMK2_024862 [Sinanodonta woodiana]|uniref:C2H2-type domain-containing protein n=1 Tax=Sinanodonta woodiana TaxID=1069815 RepID=A0ABD3XIF2_SINWO
MPAKKINHGKSSKPSVPKSTVSTPLMKKVDEPPENVDNGASVSNFSKGCEKEEIRVILHAKSEKKSSEMKFQSGATNLSSPSKLSPFSSDNHSKDKPVDYIGNHSIEGHPGQNYEMKDISLTGNLQIDVPSSSNGPYKGTRKKNGFNRLDDNVWKEQSNGESLKSNQNTKDSSLHSPKPQQTRKDPVLKWEEPIASCSSSSVESAHKVLFSPFNREESHQTSNGNMTSQCDKNNKTGDTQLPKCEIKDKKQAVVLEKYICYICTKEFRQRLNFRSHMKSHTIHSCKCGNCSLIFDSAETLIQHMQKEHTEINPYKCDQCNEEFSQLNNLQRHKISHVEETIECPHCTEKFKTVHYLTLHLHIHTGNRRVSCGVCKKQLKPGKEFTDHVYSHNKNELHCCNVCPKSFSKKCVLRQHMKSHSGDRPFECVQCNKCFVFRHHLKTHMKKSHLEPESLTCETCGNKFSQVKQLNKHKREHLEEVKLSKCSHEDSNGCNKKLINTSIPDELNGEPPDMQQKPKVEPVIKRSRGPTKKKVSAASTAYLHHGSQISKANPIQYDSSDPDMFVPLSNEPTQNVTWQMNVQLPSQQPHYNPMYMASTPVVMAADINQHMMNYPSHSGQDLGNKYALDLSLPKKHQSDESSRPLSLMRDSSLTVSSARNAPISSVPIYQNNPYFHNSTFARPVEVSSYMPVLVPIDLSLRCPIDLSLRSTKRGIRYGESDVEDLSSRGSLSNSSFSWQPDILSPNDESGPIDHLKSASTSFMKPHIDQKIENTEWRCNKPVGINGHANSLPNDCSSQNKRKRRKNETYMLNSQDLTRSTAVEDRKLKKCRKLKANGKNVDRKEERYVEEEKQVEDNASQSEEISFLKRQIKEVREMILNQCEIQKETIDTMTDIEEEEEEGRLIIVEDNF